MSGRKREVGVSVISTEMFEEEAGYGWPVNREGTPRGLSSRGSPKLKGR